MWHSVSGSCSVLSEIKIVYEDGLVTGLEIPEDLSLYDVYKAAREVQETIEHDLLINDIVNAVARMLTPKDPVVESKKRIAEKVKNRAN